MFNVTFRNSASAKNTALEYSGTCARIKAHIYGGNIKEMDEEILGNDKYIPEIDAKFFESRPKLFNRVIFIDRFEVDIFLTNDTRSASVDLDRFIDKVENLYGKELIVVVPTRSISFRKIDGKVTVYEIRNFTKSLLEDDCNMNNRNFLGYPEVYIGDYYNLLMSKQHRNIETDEDNDEGDDE